MTEKKRMVRTGLFRGALGVLLISMVTSIAQAAAGRTSGMFDVSAVGSVNYSIPIWTPPGPRGMAPSLALAYNSNGENGILGVGWSLGGLSSIERCKKTEAQDGIAGAVTLIGNDVFCLDGNRLRVISGAYGAANSTYATEIADFSTITAEGIQNNGPQSFTVVAKSGITYEYGKSADSRVAYWTDGPVARWLLKTVRDTSGNSYTIQYETTNAVPVPTTITWGAAGEYTAVFSYGLKTPGKDYLVWYIAGQINLSIRRLERISIRHNGTTQRQYVLGYDVGPVTERSRLTRVTECAQTESDCLSPTEIVYQAGQAIQPNSISVSVANANMIGAADFNGDRKDDLIYTQGANWYVMFGGNGGFGATIQVAGLSGTLGDTVDYDAFMPGGRAAFISLEGGTLVTYTAVDRNSDGLFEEFVRASAGLDSIAWPSSRLPTSFGGNLTWVGPTSQGVWRIRQARNITEPNAVSPQFETNDQLGGSSIPTNVTINGRAGTVTPSSVYIIGGRGLERRDFNGDGYDEFYLHVSVSYSGSGEELLAPVLAGGLAIDQPSTWTNWGLVSLPLPTPIHFNDDRCSDVGNVDGSASISGCGGAGALTSQPASGTQRGWLDWDGDGRMDLLVDNGGTFAVYLSTGRSFGAVISTPIPAAGKFLAMDLDGDGMDDIVRLEGSGAGTSLRYHTHSASPQTAILYATEIPDVATSITDGLGVQYRIDYVSTAHHNYIEVSPPPLPLVRDDDPHIVVARAQITDGAGGTYMREFVYVGAARDRVRERSVGFLERHETDGRTGLVTKIAFEQAFPKTGRTRSVDIWRNNDGDGTAKLLSRTEMAQREPVPMLNSTAFQQRYFPSLERITFDKYESAGAQQLILTEQTVFEELSLTNGEPRTVRWTATSYDSSAPGTWRNTITTDRFASSAGCLDLPSTVTTTSQAPFQNAITRTVEYTPDGAYCRHKTETVRGTNSNYDFTTTYGYDARGNINSVREDAKEPTDQGTYQSLPTRETTLVWTETASDKSTAMTRKVTDSFSETSRVEYFPATGLVKKETDPNQQSTQWDYDSFGRLKTVVRPDGTSMSQEYTTCGASCLSGGQHVITVTQTNRNIANAVVSDGTTYVDRYDRPLVTRVSQINGSYMWREVQYNAKGQLWKQSVPCATNQPTASCAAYWTEFAYDAVGRVQTTTRAGEGGAARITRFAYNGLRTTITDPLNKVSSKVVDAAGRLYRSTDANQYTQSFTYDGLGSLTRVSDSSKTLFEASYEYGRQALQVSARSYAQTASTAYQYDGFGRLRRWTDAGGLRFAMTYDALSRPLTRRDGIVDASNQEALTSWVWGRDASLNNIGRLADLSITSVDGTYRELYDYDGAGRMASQTIRVPGDTTSYTYGFAYDPNTGTLDTLTYPSSTGTPFALKYDNTGGILRSVREVNGPEFWSLNGASPLNAFGSVTGERFGNGVVRARDFDPVTGWLEKITAGPSGNETGLQNSGVLYDAVGNVLQRQNNLGSLPASLSEDFTNSNDALYRFRTGVVNGAVTLDIQEYDDLGNIRRKSDNSGVDAPVDYTVTWTSYNYPASIDSPTMKEKVSFAYGPTRNRWRMVYQDTATNRLETTYYLGALMEKVVTTEGTTTRTEYRHYIHAGNTPVAIHSRVVGGTNATRYMLADHLGSIDTIVDGAGTKLVDSSYTPYGLQRDPSDWRGAPASLHHEYTRQGYSFQTVLGRLGLNHMNGRVQDAISGQFLSPDPLVTRPDNTQSWNRYAYVQNNPLTFIDPSGLRRVCWNDYSPINLVWIRINGEWIENMPVDSTMCEDYPDPLDYTELAWDPSAFSNDDPSAGGAPPEVFLPTPELNISPGTECSMVADNYFAPKERDVVDKIGDGADAIDMAVAPALASRAAEAAAKQSWAAQVGAAAAVNAGTYRPTPGVAHQGLTALGEARAAAGIFRWFGTFGGIVGTGADSISAAQNFSDGDYLRGSIDTTTAIAGATALAAPETAPISGYIWAMGKMTMPYLRSIIYYQCMGVDMTSTADVDLY